MFRFSISLHSSDSPGSSTYKRYKEQYNKNEENDLSYSGCTSRYPTKTEYCCNDCNNKKYNCPA